MFNDYLEIKNKKGKKSNNIKNININLEIKVLCLLTLSTVLIRSLFKYQIIISYIKQIKNEITQIENYKEICEKAILLNKIEFKKIKNPKISIISAVYNRGKYILRFIRSIQNQFFNDIEIILIDDFSNDNTIEIIEQCQKEDERIILIKHKQNKGTLISRNDGVLISSGEYLIFPDPDDILSNDILYYCYTEAKNKDYDMIKYNYSISNKFVKRDIYIKSLNYIDKYYLNQNMIVYEDGLINYMLYKYAKILYITKKVGYYYIQNQQSITKNFLNDRERTLKNCFVYLKYIFEYTKNNQFEKDIACCIYHNVLLEISNISIFKYLTKDYKFYYDIINNYLKNEFISIAVKNQLINILKFIEIAEFNYNNKNISNIYF